MDIEMTNSNNSNKQLPQSEAFKHTGQLQGNKWIHVVIWKIALIIYQTHTLETDARITVKTFGEYNLMRAHFLARWNKAYKRFTLLKITISLMKNDEGQVSPWSYNKLQPSFSHRQNMVSFRVNYPFKL